MLRPWFCACLVACICCACAPPDAPDPGPLLIHAPASTAEAVHAAAAGFHRASGVPVRVTVASSAVLARQLAAGAPGDLFLSASVEWADWVEREGLVRERRDLLENRLVLVVPAGAERPPRDPADLLAATVSRIAIGEPETVPAGRYACEALTRMQLWAPLQPKLVSGADVRQALFFVERGEADAGIVYATDAAIARGVRTVYTFHPDDTGPIRYPLALIRRQEEHPAARDFYDFLASPAAQAIFADYGFLAVPTPTQSPRG